MTYAYSITGPLLNNEAMGCLNDIVVIGPNEILATIYQAMPDSIYGRYVLCCITIYLGESTSIFV